MYSVPIKRNISVIGTVGLPAKYGGFETLVEHLVNNLGNKYFFRIYCSSKSYSNRIKTYKGAQLIYIPLSANGTSSILYDALSIIHSIFFSHILLVLGVSGAFMFPLIKFFTSKVIITNIDGLEWKRDKWGKIARLYLKWQEKIAVKYSDEIIADNKGIQDYIKEEYDRESNLISYGSDHASKIPLIEDTKLKYCIDEKYAFSVCRIEPENNIHLILQAFSNLDEQIVIIGNWDASQYGINLRKKFSRNNNICLLDPIYDQQKLDSIRSNCNLYIHGHSAGGTNPSLVEAMWLELPIFCYDVHYNKYTTDFKAKYFDSSDELSKLIRQTTLEDLNQIKIELKNVAIRNYTWNKISNDYSILFQNHLSRFFETKI